MAGCVNLLVDLLSLTFTSSIISDKFGFTVLSVGQRDAAEFRDYSFVAPSVFYKCMF
jgi:hypothetical protein